MNKLSFSLKKIKHFINYKKNTSINVINHSNSNNIYVNSDLSHCENFVLLEDSNLNNINCINNKSIFNIEVYNNNEFNKNKLILLSNKDISNSISCQIKNKKLNIFSNKDKDIHINLNVIIKIYIDINNISSFTNNSVGNLTIKEDCCITSCELKNSGVGNIIAENFYCDLFDVLLNSTGYIKLKNVSSKKCFIKSKGVGNLTLQDIDSYYSDFLISSVGNITSNSIIGNEIKIYNSGIGNFNAKKAKIKKAIFSLKGIGNVTISQSSISSINSTLSGIGSLELH